MTPELKALVGLVRDTMEEAGAAANAANPRLTFEEWRAVRALAAIRCVAEATREADDRMTTSAAAASLWRAMHAASVLGEALRHE
jgi:hypothetical protein